MMFALMVALVLLPEVSQRLDALARQVAGEHCPAGAQLEQTLELAPGRTVFAYSFATHPFPDNDCMPEYRCAWVAVRVERGTTEFSSVEDGEPRELGIGPDGSAWLYTLWTMEGGIPHLWRSVDGMKWQEVGRFPDALARHDKAPLIEAAELHGLPACRQLAELGDLFVEQREGIVPRRRASVLHGPHGLVRRTGRRPDMGARDQRHRLSRRHA
jgi:hypothetical protein